MAARRVTITDVARAANVHASTVSRVLNGRAELSLLPETRERVIAAATRLGYRPSALARSLRLRRTFTLGMLVPDIANPVFPPIIKGVEGAAHARGYHLILCNTDDSFEREASYLRVLREWRVDGILIASSSTAESTIAELRREKFPFVLVNSASRTGDDACVVPDNRLGVSAAIDHLTRLGHRRIGLIAAPQTTTTGQERLMAARAALRRHHLAHDDALVAVADSFSEASGYRAARRLLLDGEPPTAIFGANDLIALGAIRLAREIGLAVPADLSVVGFNDIPQSELFDPPLTTVRVPQEDMGVLAAALLIDQLEGRPIERRRLVLETELVVRGSTAPPPASTTTVMRTA
ncbi:MAG TPA: LacI family DNA-binding transcriptional regulator [Candidatus Limnocylindria bacterium]|nr:LacI family DNA-binding transcriptional regulator [Candidatus Limnocylindria bacterium]